MIEACLTNRVPDQKSGAYLKIVSLLSCLLSVFLTSCYKDMSSFEVQNLNGNKIGILGHRGMGKDSSYPENSLESIESVLKIGADGSELDVQITKDSVLVIFHDWDLSKKTNCQGLIRDYDWAQIDSCTYRIPVSDKIQILTVDSLFSSIPSIRNYYFSFDCEIYPQNEPLNTYFRQYVFALKQVIEKHAMNNRVLIEAGSTQLHQMLKQSEVQAYQFITGAGITAGIQIAEDLDLYGIGIGSAVTRKDIELAHEKGFRVMTWTPKTRWANIRAIKKNPDFIQTAKPIHMLKLFGKYRDGYQDK